MTRLGQDSDSEPETDTDQHSQAQSQYVLAFDDGKITSQEDLLQFTISRIGGTPVLLPLQHTDIPQSDLECLTCQNPLPLLLQIYGPSIQNPSHDRVVYLFGCPDEKCQTQCLSKSVRAFKSWKFNQEYHQQSLELDDQPGPELGENPFKINSAYDNPFGQSFENPFATAPTKITIFESSSLEQSFSKLELTPPTSVEKRNSSLMANLPILCSPPHYLTTGYELEPKSGSSFDASFQGFEEQDGPTSAKMCDKHSLKNKNHTNGADHTPPLVKKSVNQYQESYEVQVVKGVDPVFLDFQDRVNWENQASQIVRYNPSGRPLMVSSERPLPSIPSITCGHEAKFEVQLMPASLKFYSNMMAWTTVWVEDCVEDCPGTDEGWVELQCFVQAVD